MIASSIAGILRQKHRIAIASHIMPDGDSIGSMLALYNILAHMGKDVSVYSSDIVPSIYSFLPNCERIEYCDDLNEKEFEVLVVLDCGSIERTGKCSILAKKADLSINIDHHGTNSLFADINLVDTNSSATGELIYQIIKLMGMDVRKEEAICLYTAIFTDTGGFRYSNTTSITHQIAGDLINTGIHFSKVYDLIYRNFSYNDVKIKGKALSSIELYNESKVAYMELLLEDLDGLSLEEINTSDFIDYARDINTVEVAVFVKQVDDFEYKLSFRSKNIVNVKRICEKYGGGGHDKAAGCTIKGELSYYKELIIHELEDALRDGER